MEIRVDESATGRDGVGLWPLYAEVFGDHEHFDDWRAAVGDRHRGRDGFRIARVDAGDGLAGFAYGYTGERGQWWTDHAAEVLEPSVGDSWLGGHFELVSIAVRPDARRGGVGTGLMRALTDGLPHQRLLLMTSADDRDPARALYAREGWDVIGRGIGKGTVIMGKLNGGQKPAAP